MVEALVTIAVLLYVALDKSVNVNVKWKARKLFKCYL